LLRAAAVASAAVGRRPTPAPDDKEASSLESEFRSKPSWYVTLRTGTNGYRAAIAWLSHLERALEGADPEARAMPLLAAAAAESP
jgi:hypothetical protein